jgi:hypothetical protein
MLFPWIYEKNFVYLRVAGWVQKTLAEIGYRSVTNENNWIIPWIFAIFFVYLLCNMIDMINKWVTNNKIWLKALGDFTFLAFVFWLFYWALWIFCPC